MSTPLDIFKKPPGPARSIDICPEFPEHYNQIQKMCTIFHILMKIVNTGIHTLLNTTSINIEEITPDQLKALNKYLAMYSVKMNIDHVYKPKWYYFDAATECFLKKSSTQMRFLETPVQIIENTPIFDIPDHITKIDLTDFNQIIYCTDEFLSEAYIIKFTWLDK